MILNGYKRGLINSMVDLVNILRGIDILYDSSSVTRVKNYLEDPTASKLLALIGVNDTFIANLSKAINDYPDVNWDYAFSKGQLLSKLWIVHELKRLDLDLGNIFVCAGWIGILPALMFKEPDLKIKNIKSFDIDPTCEAAADRINKPYVIDGWKFNAITMDIHDIDYQKHTFRIWRTNHSVFSDPFDIIPNTIINTSCDHIFPFEKWWDLIPQGKIIILQNNNSKLDDDHVNNVNSLEEMKKQAPMSKILFEGELELSMYTRYMLIGIK